MPSRRGFSYQRGASYALKLSSCLLVPSLWRLPSSLRIFTLVMASCTMYVASTLAHCIAYMLGGMNSTIPPCQTIAVKLVTLDYYTQSEQFYSILQQQIVRAEVQW
eukprot:gene10192-11278_t